MGRCSFKTFLFKLSFLIVISIIYKVNKYQVDCLLFPSNNLRKVHVYYVRQCDIIVQFLLNKAVYSAKNLSLILFSFSPILSSILTQE